MSPRIKFILVVAGLFLYVLVGLAVLAAAVSSDLGPGERDVFEDVLRREASLAVFVGVLFLLGLAGLVWLFFSRYVVAPRRLARAVELIATANPGHRLEPSGPAEMRAIATAVNELAGRAEETQEGVLDQVVAARVDLEQERNRLAALMSELTLAVLVCNAEGRMLLYNRAAQEVAGHDLVGLGRSIFGILDRALVAHALERLDADSQGAPGVRLAASTKDGRLLRIGMAPVPGRAEEDPGFVLILEDVTEIAGAGLRRDALLRSLSEDSRAAVASIRAAVESMLDYPQMGADERRRFTEVIRHEAETLSARIDAAVAEPEAQLGEQWVLSEMLASDLLAAARAGLERETGVAVEAAELEDELWLQVDSYALMQALGHLAGRLATEVALGRLTLDVGRARRHARLDLAWEGAGIAEERLQGWVEEPLGLGGGPAATVREVVERHGGEIFAQADRGAGRAWVRLLLPAAEPTERPSAPRAPTIPSRPEFYDFDLFAGGLDHEGGDSALERLAFTVFDTETTGLSPATDEIVAIGAVRIVNGRLLRQESFDRLVDPGRPVTAAAVAVHGISTEMLAGQPSIDEVLPAFARFAADTVLVGHNLSFDMRFFELKEVRTGVRLTQPVLDTLLLSALVHPDEEDHSLEAIAARLGVSVLGRHTALGDAILTGEIFLKQSRLLAARGLSTLAEVREAAQRTYLARVSDSLYAN